MLIKRGDVYDIDFGSSIGSVQCGRRPGVIIQNNMGNMFSPNVVAIPITSQNKQNLPTHVYIKQGEGGLIKNSIALLENPLTVSKTCLYSKMGTLSDSTMIAIDKALDISLGRANRAIAVAAAPTTNISVVH